MKLAEPTLEALAIRSICDGDKKVSSTLLSSLDETYFHTEATSEAYKRIMSLVRSKGRAPAFFEICSDPIISETSRRFLKKKKPKIVKDKGRAASLTDSLLHYRRLRQMYFMYEDGQKALLKDSVDLEKLIEENTENLANAKSRSGIKKEMLHMGRGDNTAAIQKRLLGNEKPPMVPTGFLGWDKRNGGISFGALMMIGATSGGGKSALANQMLINMAGAGYSSCLVALEMSDEDCMARIYANLTNIEVTKFMQRKTSRKEKVRTKKRYRRFKIKLKKASSRYSIFSPEEDVNIDQVLFHLKPYDYDVILIDYAGLLSGLDSDDQWRKLSAVARQCKTYARIHNKVIVLLAQLSEEGMIRYSKGMKEHSDVFWSWTYTDQNRETGMIYIVPQKSRNQDPTPFELWHDFQYMQVRDPTKQEIHAVRQSPAAGEKKKKLEKTVEDMERYLQV